MIEGQEVFFWTPRDEWVEIDDTKDPSDPLSGYRQDFGLFLRWFNQTKIVMLDGRAIEYHDLTALVANYVTMRMEYVSPLLIDINKTNLQNGRIIESKTSD